MKLLVDLWRSFLAHACVVDQMTTHRHHLGSLAKQSHYLRFGVGRSDFRFAWPMMGVFERLAFEG